ncbi:hypothetical protein RHGRI_009666 [Rhododendron griersonianum]|uniref:MADS-box domain-containing protein n=1 Tax=Rhododendron griersonianum TaxID=479676 RepID=A0AAV6KGE6_9ERIC|nr:hypothetical protein RHGRI_009666 [Rhododendron griersonianum]
MVTFYKRRKGLFKKAHELHCLTGADIAIVAFSLAGRPYTHGEPSFESTIDKCFDIEGKETTKSGTGGDHKCNKTKLMIRSWLEGIKVEACESVDDLVLVKNVVEEIN